VVNQSEAPTASSSEAVLDKRLSRAARFGIAVVSSANVAVAAPKPSVVPAVSAATAAQHIHAVVDTSDEAKAAAAEKLKLRAERFGIKPKPISNAAPVVASVVVAAKPTNTNTNNEDELKKARLLRFGLGEKGSTAEIMGLTEEK
jgi:hypothetical protein